MGDLIAFLEARLADDAAVLEEGRSMYGGAVREIHRERSEFGTWQARASDEYAAIDLSYARFMDEIAAKRLIVATARYQMEHQDTDINGDQLGPIEKREREATIRLLEGTLEVLATVYADHPDYQEAWRP